MFRFMLLTLTPLFILATSQFLSAQEKHPRVAELEDQLKAEANNFLKSRFPSLPFSVQVSIDAIRRQTSEYYEPKGETLPFYAIETEEIRDEWDDPSASLYSLRNRVKKIYVEVEVPSKLSATETSEIKDSITESLRLIPARDEIVIQKREWTLFPKMKTYLIIGASALTLFLIGLLIIMKLSTRSLGKQLGELQSQMGSISNTNSNRPQRSVSPIPQPETTTNKRVEPDVPHNDLQFHDPIRTREIVIHKINNLLQSEAYLNLENFISLNELGLSKPDELGALLVMFPIEQQKEWLAFSHGTHWFEALDKPGSLSNQSINIVEGMCRVYSERFDQDWEKLLVQVWRLGDQSHSFLKKLPQNEAFSILTALPKSIAVPTARAVFPGAWASILDQNYVPEVIEAKRVKELFEQATHLKPLVAHSDFKAYQKDKELIRYLHEASVEEERDIYEASLEDSTVKKLRPPFYKIFEANVSDLDRLIQHFKVEDWALALFDSPRDWRAKIETRMDDKEKFLYYEHLKRFDKLKPNRQWRGDVRAEMARFYSEMLWLNSLNIEEVSSQQEPHDSEAA